MFEKNDTQKVEEIELLHEEISSIGIIEKSGTILEISSLRENWERTDLLRLRAALMKLVSPEKIVNSKETTIFIIAEHEKEEDEKELALDKRGVTKNNVGRLIVNGPVINDVFEKLGVKTTSITVNLSEDGETIETIIEDRGDFIFRIVSVFDLIAPFKGSK